MMLVSLLQRPSLLERLLDKVIPEPNSGCWLWVGGNDGKAGYGSIRVGRDKLKAHRVSHELFKGPIPAGQTIHHRCNTPACVNPDHLQPMTFRENNRHSNSCSAKRARQTHCNRGHELSGDNLLIVVARQCRACVRAAKRAGHKRRREKGSD